MLSQKICYYVRIECNYCPTSFLFFFLIVNNKYVIQITAFYVYNAVAEGYFNE